VFMKSSSALETARHWQLKKAYQEK
jgi:hypothetical protein